MLGNCGSSTVRELSEMVRECACEACEGGRASWELLVMLLVCESDEVNCPLTCDGDCEER